MEMEEERKEEELLPMLRKISRGLNAQMEMHLKNADISGTQMYLLVYILKNHPQGTYLTQLCHETGVSKPTLSVMIKKLKENGYLCSGENPGDIRKKKVLPTEKLKKEGNAFIQKVDGLEAEICRVLDREEKAQLWLLEQKLLRQLTNMEHDKEHLDRRFIYREKCVETAQTV